MSSAGCKVLLQINHLGKKNIAEIEVPAGDNWQEITVPVNNIPNGIYDIELSLIDGDQVQVDWVRFE